MPIANIREQAQKSLPGEIISLFKLDTTSIGGSVYFFCQSSDLDANSMDPVSFGGQQYTPVDVEFSGLETNGVGTLPTPTIKLSNVGTGLFQAMINTYGDLLGCTLQRVRTFKRFLDDGAEPDPTAYYGPDTYRVERKVSENVEFIEWELSASIDQEGAMLPRRVVIRDTCLWRYRRHRAVSDTFDYSKAQCPYTGSRYYDRLGNEVTQRSQDECGRKLTDCELRFGRKAVLPFGGFPGVQRTR